MHKTDYILARFNKLKYRWISNTCHIYPSIVWFYIILKCKKHFSGNLICGWCNLWDFRKDCIGFAIQFLTFIKIINWINETIFTVYLGFPQSCKFPPSSKTCWLLDVAFVPATHGRQDHGWILCSHVQNQLINFSRFTLKWLSSHQWVLLEFTDSHVTTVQVLPCGRQSEFLAESWPRETRNMIPYLGKGY